MQKQTQSQQHKHIYFHVTCENQVRICMCLCTISVFIPSVGANLFAPLAFIQIHLYYLCKSLSFSAALLSMRGKFEKCLQIRIILTSAKRGQFRTNKHFFISIIYYICVHILLFISYINIFFIKKILFSKHEKLKLHLELICIPTTYMYDKLLYISYL